ncbi:MAG: hypothetical protein M1834_008732 [Cirrosporium novae-zelandiae]|nr:MAG: hypothetical protein M1834_008732 [Cirrosporium novae-zelandiae]
MASYRDPLTSPVDYGYAPASTSNSGYAPYYDSRDTSPPQTPRARPHRVARSRGSKKSLHVRPSLRETFLDDMTPIDNLREDESFEHHGKRDSHDLLFSEGHVTRDSVVSNMLLSLDQFSTMPSPIYSNYEEEDEDNEPYVSKYPSSNSGRTRAHTQTSSYSSEYNIRPEHTSARHSNQFSHVRRNASTSNFQNCLPKIDSLFADESDTARGQVYEAQRATVPNEHTGIGHTRGRRNTGKSSGSSSMDFSQMVGASRYGYPIGRRSASFDHSYTSQGIVNAPQLQTMNLQWSYTQNFGSQYDYSEAAPTPTIPAGPRRPPSPPTVTPIKIPPIPTTPSLGRKRSTRSSKSTHNRKDRSETLRTTSIKSKGDDFQRIQDSLREMPPLPYINPSAPSPIVSLHKQASEAQAPPKERQGFFKRVFSSAKNNVSHNIPQIPPSDPSHKNSDKGRHLSHGKLSKQVHRDSSMPPPLVPQKENIPTISKKPSSFFRRRKKSVTESHTTPMLSPLLANLGTGNTHLRTAEPSPASSLRKVMDPYLTETIRMVSSNHELDVKPEDGVDRVYENHPSNEFPNRGDTSHSVPQQATRKGSTNSEAEQQLPPKPHSSQADYRTMRQLNLPDYGNEETFLVDSSGGEGASVKSNNDGSHGPLRPKTSPAKPTFSQESSVSIPRERTSSRQSTYHDESLLTTNGRGQTSTPIPGDSNGTLTQGISPNLSTASIEDGWLSVVPSSKPKDDSSGVGLTDKSDWFEPEASTDHLSSNSTANLSCEGTKDSPKSPQDARSIISDYKSASSVPIVQIDGKDQNDEQPSTDDDDDDDDDDEAVNEAPEVENLTEADQEQARKIFEGDEADISRSKAAAWLGDEGPTRGLVRHAYMEMFDWSGLNILAALRELCGKLILKAETQQVDRILDSFSTRWCDCNPNHGFKASDVVHTICYSLLLLNTDLYLADIDQKMTRNQFIKNTLPTIRRVATDAAPDAFDTHRLSTVPVRSPTPWAEPTLSGVRSPTFPTDNKDGRVSVDHSHPSTSLTPRALDRTIREEPTSSHRHGMGSPIPEGGPLVNSPFKGTVRAWESQIEVVLKEFYNSISKQRLPLHGSNERVEQPSSSSYNLSAAVINTIRRAPSTISKAGSENFASRGRTTENHLSTGRWTSKTRSRGRMYPNSTIGSSRTSLDDQSSIWSPSTHSTWSRPSMGKTLTSMSVDSFGSAYPTGDYQQSIGFANALSQAIIREESAISGFDEISHAVPLLEDESLGLAGAPWAKEGILRHKHHLDAVDKKSRDRNWVECFAVIEKGCMRLFQFNVTSKSVRQKAKKQPAGGVVGGGNWTENMEALESYPLRHTIASALPPPGYSKSRPHVWALSLPTGAVHLFQVGTPEIIREFVSSANYWSARLSKEPLVGGISNIEYGWSEAVINTALVNTDEPQSSRQSFGHHPRPSLQGSIRSSIDQQFVRPRLPGDRIFINDWTPPPQSMMASALMEVDQLKALIAYVKSIEEELQKHNELRSAMLLAYSPRHPNHGKAMANWERKSSYLLREIVKFRTYIDCLHAAQAQKDKIYAARPAEEQETELENHEEQEDSRDIEKQQEKKLEESQQKQAVQLGDS